MNVEKFIRILGYIVYVALWSPVIVLLMVILPIWVMCMCKSIPNGWVMYKKALKYGFEHDAEFIKTGVWY